MSGAPPALGIIGGSGVGRLAGGKVVATHPGATVWGAPSAPIEEREVDGLRILFLPRHGPHHTIPPHRVNYRANIEALVGLGARRILALNSVGSLREELTPGTFVLPSQFVDFTHSRPTTFYDEGRVVHVSMADPFCPEMTGLIHAAGAEVGIPIARDRTYVCVEGPRFSTRAESRLFRGFAEIIGMTAVPEVTLARERAVCYGLLAMVTDFDVWAERPVQTSEILRVMGENGRRVQEILGRLVPKLGGAPTCSCARALDEAGV
ncbi:MAG: S-methyl-5'-thioadenosine phosphorylase [Thermoplasmata archaeon]